MSIEITGEGMNAPKFVLDKTSVGYPYVKIAKIQWIGFKENCQQPCSLCTRANEGSPEKFP